MNTFASKIKKAFEAFSPPAEAIKPENDNDDQAALKIYVTESRAQAGFNYQPARAKMWWLP